MLLELQKRTNEIKRGTTLISLSQTAQDQLQAILGISQTAQEKAMQLHIRKRLGFAEIAERYTIGKLHDRTFTWFFGSNASPEMTPERIDPRKRYVELLSSGTGISHIAGKPRAGKSTLMKFLPRDPSITAGLSQWAGRSSSLIIILHAYLLTLSSLEIIVVGFFFWKPAHSKLLKSIPGVLRSLLHDVLQKRPDLVPTVFL
jgi:hypothetical protein